MIAAYMLNMSPPNENSPNWYKNFHNIFWFSQLTNVLFLSYMQTYVETDETLKRISPDKSVSDYLDYIIKKFSNNNKNIEETLPYLGVSCDLPKEVDIKLEDLKKLCGSDSWYDIMRGFLNIWDFLFLFSAFESAMKQALDCERLKGAHIIQTIRKKIGPITSGTHMEQIENCLWPFFCDVRNLYSHSHGIVNPSDLEKLKESIENAHEFTENPAAGMKKQFEEMDENEKLYCLSRLTENTFFKEDTFDSARILEGNFFFISDQELNIFRNIISDICSGINNNSGRE